MMKRLKWIAAVLLGTSLFFTSASASENLPGYLDSIEILIENDSDQTNQKTILQLLESASGEVEPGSEAAAALTSLQALIKSGTAEKETLLSLLNQARNCLSGNETEGVETEKSVTPENTEMLHEATGLPEYVSEGYLWKLLSDNASLQIPGNWYSNDSGASLVNYSDVSESGHISPAGGTLTTNYYAAEAGDESAAIEEYANNLEKLKMVSDFRQEDLTLAGLQARHMIYNLAAGANDFTCDNLCVDYNGTVYSVQVTQGAKSSFDYFPMFDNAVRSLTFGEEAVTLVKEQETEAPKPETETLKPETETPKPETETPKPETETSKPETEAPQPQPETELQTGGAADGLASFTYSIDGNNYSFPTNVRDLTQASAWMDLDAEIEYKLRADADLGGLWTEISNTEYIFLTNTMYQEMIGVTNMSERDITMKEGVVTTLVDTEGDNLSLTLPGQVKVGASEDAVSAAYPAFDQLEWDGNAGIIGDREMIFAKNIRDDGCRGYAIVRGDAPYYSALTIICENGIIREICFECLGSKKAGAIFS